MKKQGFTLIELLVVIAIIGVLAALIAPAIANTRERAHAVGCMNNMKQIVVAALIYADEHGETIPDVTELSSYLDDEDVYICPRDTRSGLGATRPSYTAWKYTPASLLPSHVNGLFSERVLYLESDDAGDIDKSLIVDENVTYRHDGRTVVVFADGHVISGSENEVTTFLGMSIIPEEEEPL